jgi:zinc transport system substrate-binding protein
VSKTTTACKRNQSKRTKSQRYFAVGIAFEGKAPKPAQLKVLIQHASENGIKVVFVQPQFSITNAEPIAREIGGQVAFANPLAEDWIANLRQVADTFRTASA